MSIDVENVAKQMSEAEKKKMRKILDQEANPSITSKDEEIKALQDLVKKTATDRKVTPTEVMTALLKALRIGGRIGRGLGSELEELVIPKVKRTPKAAKPAAKTK